MEYMRVHVYIALVHLQWVHFVQARDWKLAIFEEVHSTHLSGVCRKGLRKIRGSNLESQNPK